MSAKTEPQQGELWWIKCRGTRQLQLAVLTSNGWLLIVPTESATPHSKLDDTDNERIAVDTTDYIR